MAKKWFRNKTYGYGWTPTTWQGYVVVLAAIGLIMWRFRHIDQTSHSASDTLTNAVPFALVVILLLTIISYTFGEPPRWQWGNKNQKRDS